MKCPTCGFNAVEDAVYCSNCGAVLRPDTPGIEGNFVDSRQLLAQGVVVVSSLDPEADQGSFHGIAMNRPGPALVTKLCVIAENCSPCRFRQNWKGRGLDGEYGFELLFQPRIYIEEMISL